MARLKIRGKEKLSTHIANGSEPKVNKGKPESDKWDDVCAICDDGGTVVCCEGRCLRSFHPMKEHGEESKCGTLGLTEEQWKVFESTEPNTPDFTCKNCKYKQHQCFACGLLGSSDLSSKAEVFQCRDQNCGHFYHPKCVARLLQAGRDTRAVHLEQHVAGGLKFKCPMHRCRICKQGENKDDRDLQFALCRRCPTAYHRKCLPSDIVFKSNTIDGTMKRAWGNVLSDRILIYCMNHEIERRLGTPKRDHIVFPAATKILNAKRPKDTLKQGMPLGHTSSKPSQPSLPDETGNDPCSCSSPMDSFAPKALFPHPHPGSGGWLDD